MIKKGIDLTKGKVTSIKKSWIVRAEIAFGKNENHPMHEAFVVREKAREYKRLLKGMGNWENIKMYRAVEVTFGDGSIILTMDLAR